MRKRFCPKVKTKGAKQIRHTHRTAAGLEDALAVAWDIIHELQAALIYADGRARRSIEILQDVRKGPHSYDPDKPAGERHRIKVTKR